jgi:carbon monoxide dehydrogenase subunit G
VGRTARGSPGAPEWKKEKGIGVDRTEGQTEIAAGPADVLAVITDFDAYPQWAAVKTAEVKRTDARGRPVEVAFSFSQMGFEGSYTLVYRFAPRNGGVSWSTKNAEGVVRDVEGEYVLEPTEGGTSVTYRLALELNISLPSFLRKTAERTIISTALDGLKKRVEG